MLNQGSIEDQGLGSSSQMGSFYLNPTSSTTTCDPPWMTHSWLKSYFTLNLPLPCSHGNDTNNTSLTQALLSSSLVTQNHRHEDHEEDASNSFDMGGGLGSPNHLLSLQRSTPNLWVWGEGKEWVGMSKKSGPGGDENRLGVSPMNMKMKKKMKGRRKVREPRFCFKTMSDVDVLDDGYKWRKYGQKVVKNTLHPRSYYRCTQDNCRVKKRVERLAEDPRMVITTYEGRHVHSPSHDLEESQGQPHVNEFLW